MQSVFIPKKISVLRGCLEWWEEQWASIQELLVPVLLSDCGQDTAPLWASASKEKREVELALSKALPSKILCGSSAYGRDPDPETASTHRLETGPCQTLQMHPVPSTSTIQ